MATAEQVGSADYPRFRALLEENRERLQSELEDGAGRRLASERYSALAGEAPDTGDASVATEQSDLRNAQIDRDVGELRAVEAAISRIDDGIYGICTSCGTPIAPPRLKANAAAERCIDCQAAYEKQFADRPTQSVPRSI